MCLVNGKSGGLKEGKWESVKGSAGLRAKCSFCKKVTGDRESVTDLYPSICPGCHAAMTCVEAHLAKQAKTKQSSTLP
jgi:hypothetical protein